MAARSTCEVPRCGACNQAFWIVPRPELLAFFAGTPKPSPVFPCPYCGFLNPAVAVSAITSSTLTLVRPTEVGPPVLAREEAARELSSMTRGLKVCPFLALSNQQDVESASVTAA